MLCVVTATMHKLTAGDGYMYLIRQVAAHDATARGRDTLADYYSSKGESPGLWMGSGLPTLRTIGAGDEVTEAHMLALFGEGKHPAATAIEAQHATALVADGASKKDAAALALRESKLGNPFRIHSGVTEFRKAVGEAFTEHNAALGLPAHAPVDDDVRAQIRTRIAREMFETELGRAPLDDRELSGWVAKNSRAKTTAVAGYDVTFSPVKSVSALWALAPREMSEAIEAAHHDAVKDALDWFENNALLTRLGTDGVQQVDTEGMLAAAFTHRDSRAGEPDLHTHVAISNKVKVKGQNKWLAIDGRPLHKAMVAISETYNTRLEGYLRDRLGVDFAERVGTDPGKRPIREIVGVDADLAARWSSRAGMIDLRRGELAAEFQRELGREPTPAEARKLNQRANLETREAKHEPRSLAEQRAAWRAEAIEVLGNERTLSEMIRRTTHDHGPVREPVTVDAQWIADSADHALSVVGQSRARWQQWHVRAEAARIVRAHSVPSEQMEYAITAITDAALDPQRSVALGPDDDLDEPGVLRRSNGASVYTTEGTRLYTCESILAAEDRLVQGAQLDGGRSVDPLTVDLALLEHAANKFDLNASQAQMVRELATSGKRLQLALAPAGTGKTTAMAVLRSSWEAEGGHVLGLAPTAAAASALEQDLDATTDTLGKLVHTLRELDDAAPGEVVTVPDWFDSIDHRSLVVIDEAGMASTADLDLAVQFVLDRGGSVRLVGDDQQLASVAAGGVLRDIATTTGAITLTDVVRFEDNAEGLASLDLRAGNAEAIGFYIDNNRVHVGDLVAAEDQAYSAWQRDIDNGLDAVMLAPTRETVRTLNERARIDRLAATGKTVIGREITVADGLHASVGDVITTRRNDRRLVVGATDFVRNGNRWTIEETNADGSLKVRRIGDSRVVTLPADYVSEQVTLGYARTIHGAQGITADTCHTVLSGHETRQLAYVAATRGRHENHLYFGSALDGDEHSVITPEAVTPQTAVDLFTRILGRDGAQESATTAARRLADPAERLPIAAAAYDDAVGTAAEQVLGDDEMERIDTEADTSVPGVTDAAAWPVLRKHLAILAVDGTDPIAVLTAAANHRELDTAVDVAAVLDWRLDPSGEHSAGHGPLPWLPAIPTALRKDPTWGSYLTARADLVDTLSTAVDERAHDWTSETAPVWARPFLDHPDLLADLAVWRAARTVDDIDLRPTGPWQFAAAHKRQQNRLDKRAARVIGSPHAATNAWRALAQKIEPRILTDPFWPVLALRLTTARRAGLDVPALLRSVTGDRPLPDEMPAAALWWRLSRTLSPAALDSTTTSKHLAPHWTPALDVVFGEETARTIRSDHAWPSLVAAVDNAPIDWEPEQILAFTDALLTQARDADDELRPDELTQALAWRITALSHHEFTHDDFPAVEHALVDPVEEEAAATVAGKADPYRSTPAAAQTHDPETTTATVIETGPVFDVGFDDYYPEPSDADLPPDPESDLPPPDFEYDTGADWDMLAESMDSLRMVRPEHEDIAPAARVAALHAELADARTRSNDLWRAYLDERGPAMTAAIPMIVDIRTRADALRPLYFAAQDAHARWLDTTHELETTDARCRDLARVAAAATKDGRDDDALHAQADLALLEILREHAHATERDAHQLWQRAQTDLETAAGGPGNIVTTADADVIRDTAASIDQMSVDDARATVRALEGEIMRAEMHEAHHDAPTVAEHTPLPPARSPEPDSRGQVAVLTKPDVDRASPTAAPKKPAQNRSTPARSDRTTARLALSDPAFEAVEPSRDPRALTTESVDSELPASEASAMPDSEPDLHGTSLPDESAPSVSSSVSTEATATAEPTETTVDPDLIEERIAEGTKAMKTATPELKAKIKQTTLSQRLNPSESGAATLARYRAELDRRAALTQDERAAEDAVRERLRKQQAKGSKGPHREPESGPRKDRGHEL
jgi:conjugative relaxase-like TrwC/TraI family protein